MFKSFIIISAIFIFFSTVAFAQTDSTSYDLGRINVKKEFTQSITLRGSDLERYQFSNLADAINVYFYGTYSNQSSLLYVIDGNIITDVNAYSIYDVEEITLVQNALTLVSGSNADQQMVLIKLKTNRLGNKGVEINGQTSYLNLKVPPNNTLAASAASFYNQYYITAYKNSKNVSLGISAEYQRDEFPGILAQIDPNIKGSYAFDSFTPSNFNRQKLNAYLKANLGKDNTINLRINYLPQTNTNVEKYVYTPVNDLDNNYVAYTTDYVNYMNKVKEHNLNLNLSIDSKLNKEITNKFSISYNHYNLTQDYNATYNSIYNTQTYYTSIISNSTGTGNNLLIRDNLTYHKNWQNFNMDASINFSFRNIKDSIMYNSDYTNYQYNSLDTYYYQNNTQTSTGGSEINYKLYFITPNLSLYNKGIFNIQVGFVDILNSDNDFNTNYKIDRIFPFISTSFNAGKFLGFKSSNLNIYGSFSKQSQLLADGYSTLTDFNSASELPINNAIQLGNKDGLKNNINNAQTEPYGSYNSFQIGGILNLIKDLTINYSFEDRYYKTFGFILSYNYGSYGYSNNKDPYYFDDNVITNRIGINYTLLIKGINWKMGLNASESELQIKSFDYIRQSFNFSDSYYANDLKKGYRWSGGFTNRFNYETFFAGIDLLYQIGDRYYNLNNVDPTTTIRSTPLNNNSFSLQNLYVGEQIKISKLKYAEVYLNGRNVLQNNSSTITDNRRFFGAGFKVAL